MKSIAALMMLLTPIYLSGQCFPDRHNTSSASSWTSCQLAPSPNTLRGNGHWIQYDLAYSYAINQMHLWNNNNPDALNQGGQDLAIDISDDGVVWQEAALLTLPMAIGLSTYEGVQGPHLGGQRARYVLITILNNYGDACYSLGEVRMEILDEIDCLVSHNLTGDLTTHRFEAQDYIYSSSQVFPGNIVEFIAGNEVELHENFTLGAGSELLVDLTACNND